MCRPRGRAFQAEGKVSANAVWREMSWHLWGTELRPARLEQSWGHRRREFWREGRAESHRPWGLLALVLSVIDRKFTAHSEKSWVVGIVARQVKELFQQEVEGCIPIRWPSEEKKELQCITPSSNRPRNWPTRFSCVHLHSFTPNGPLLFSNPPLGAC